MRKMKVTSTLAFMTLLATGCDPEAPVQSSNVSEEIDGAVAAHAGDPTTHTNLLIPAANITGEIDGADIEAGTVGIAQLDVGAVGSEEIADQSVALADMSAGSVGTLQIVDDSVTSAKIAANAITASEIAAGSIAGGLLGPIMDNTISSPDILTDSILGSDIASDAITDLELADMAVDAGAIQADAVTTAKIMNANVTTAKIADNNVTTAKILDANVTTAKIADQAITHGKLNTNMSGRGTNGAPTTVWQMVSKEGMNSTFVLIGSCRSNAAASTVIFRNDTAAVDVPGACADALANPNETFKLTMTGVDTNDLLQFQYDSAANGDTTVWEIYSVSF